jgi:hypothetical protein
MQNFEELRFIMRREDLIGAAGVIGGVGDLGHCLYYGGGRRTLVRVALQRRFGVARLKPALPALFVAERDQGISGCGADRRWK